MLDMLKVDDSLGRCELNYYHKARATLAAHNMAVMLGSRVYFEASIFECADSAIQAAEILLDKLGIVDPDKIPAAA